MAWSRVTLRLCISLLKLIGLQDDPLMAVIRYSIQTPGNAIYFRVYVLKNGEISREKVS